jgi:heat shock protein HslJ
MKQRMILVFTAAVLIAVLLAGCAAPQVPAPQTTPPAIPATLTPVVTAIRPVPPLLGTWTLISALGGMGASNALPGTTITATFADDGTVSGSAGCNNYFGSYQARVNTLTIGALATTLMTCNSPAGIMNQEKIYLSNLQGAATYSINGDILSILDADGKTLLTFRREGAAVTPVPFAGISWTLTTYKASSGSQVGVSPATTVNALFGVDGRITGSAGCNSYTGSYTASGQNGISIGPLATTLNYCGEPGVMDQETTYLGNLRAAASYEVTSDGKLHFMDTTGMPVLVFSSW